MPNEKKKGTPKPPSLKKAITVGQITGLKLIKQGDSQGGWDITVTIQREKVPSNIEQWSFQAVAVAVMEDQEAAEKALEGDFFSDAGT